MKNNKKNLKISDDNTKEIYEFLFCFIHGDEQAIQQMIDAERITNFHHFPIDSLPAELAGEIYNFIKSNQNPHNKNLTKEQIYEVENKEYFLITPYDLFIYTNNLKLAKQLNNQNTIQDKIKDQIIKNTYQKWKQNPHKPSDADVITLPTEELLIIKAFQENNPTYLKLISNQHLINYIQNDASAFEVRLVAQFNKTIEKGNKYPQKTMNYLCQELLIKNNKENKKYTEVIQMALKNISTQTAIPFQKPLFKILLEQNDTYNLNYLLENQDRLIINNALTNFYKILLDKQDVNTTNEFYDFLKDKTNFISGNFFFEMLHINIPVFEHYMENKTDFEENFKLYLQNNNVICDLNSKRYNLLKAYDAKINYKELSKIIYTYLKNYNDYSNSHQKENDAFNITYDMLENNYIDGFYAKIKGKLKSCNSKKLQELSYIIDKNELNKITSKSKNIKRKNIL